jgi:hypothetical protein
MKEEKNVPVITKAGKIWGRDSIFLGEINFINESEIEIIGSFNGSLCSNLIKGQFFSYRITFKGINLFKMIELDYNESDYQSSFDLIENSKTLKHLIKLDKKQNSGGKIDNTHKHYIFTTYDSVFEIICKNFELEIFD